MDNLTRNLSESKNFLFKIPLFAIIEYKSLKFLVSSKNEKIGDQIFLESLSIDVQEFFEKININADWLEIYQAENCKKKY